MLYVRENFGQRDGNTQCWDLHSNSLYVWLCGLDVQRTLENVCRFFRKFQNNTLRAQKAEVSVLILK